MSAEIKNRIKGKPELWKAAETDEGAVELFWKETPGAQTYIVEKYDETQQRFLKIARVAETEELTYLDADVVPGGVYRYRIVSKRKNPDGEILLKRGAPVVATVSVSYSVELTKVTHPQFGVVYLTWEADENADGYCINRRLAEAKTTLPLAFVEGQVLKYTDKTPVSGQIYFYCVQSYRRTTEDDELLFSHPGKEHMIVNLDTTEILRIKRTPERKVTFFLRVTAGADSYLLLRSDHEDGPFREVARSSGNTDLELTDQGKRGQRGAYYAVRCMRHFGGEEHCGEMTKAVYVKY